MDRPILILNFDLLLEHYGNWKVNIATPPPPWRPFPSSIIALLASKSPPFIFFFYFLFTGMSSLVFSF
jgi:hypothetical protein